MRRAVAYPFMEALLQALEPHMPEQTALELRGDPADWRVVPLHGQPPPRQVGPHAYEGSAHMIWPLGGVGAPLLPRERAIRSAVIDMTESVQDLIHELGEQDWPFPDAEVRASVHPAGVRVWFTSPDERQTLDLPLFSRTLFQDAAGRERGYTSVRESFAPVALLAAMLSPFGPDPDRKEGRARRPGRFPGV